MSKTKFLDLDNFKQTIDNSFEEDIELEKCFQLKRIADAIEESNALKRGGD